MKNERYSCASWREGFSQQRRRPNVTSCSNARGCGWSRLRDALSWTRPRRIQRSPGRLTTLLVNVRCGSGGTGHRSVEVEVSAAHLPWRPSLCRSTHGRSVLPGDERAENGWLHAATSGAPHPTAHEPGRTPEARGHRAECCTGRPTRLVRLRPSWGGESRRARPSRKAPHGRRRAGLNRPTPASSQPSSRGVGARCCVSSCVVARRQVTRRTPARPIPAGPAWFAPRGRLTVPDSRCRHRLQGGHEAQGHRPGADRGGRMLTSRGHGQQRRGARIARPQVARFLLAPYGVAGCPLRRGRPAGPRVLEILLLLGRFACRISRGAATAAARRCTARWACRLR